MPLEEHVAAYALVIGQKLRAAREARGLSQADLEGRTKIDRANIRKYEKGQLNVTIEKLLALAAALDADLTVDFVLRNVGDQEPKSK
jgi:transcriptional regulator with XRE-family HTH domain